MVANGNSGFSSMLIATDGTVYADVATECSAWLASRLGAPKQLLSILSSIRQLMCTATNRSDCPPALSAAARGRNFFSRGETEWTGVVHSRPVG